MGKRDKRIPQSILRSQVCTGRRAWPQPRGCTLMRCRCSISDGQGWAKAQPGRVRTGTKENKILRRILDIMAKESYLLQGTIYSNRQTIVSYYNRNKIGQWRQWQTRDNVPRHNGTMTCILGRSGPREFRAITPRRRAEACGSRQETRKRVGSSGSQWKISGRSGRRAEAGGRPGKGRKRSGRPWERAEEAGGLGKVTVRYSHLDCTTLRLSGLNSSALQQPSQIPFLEQ